MRQEAVAIIGIGCRFPGAHGADGFWALLESGGCGIREIPADRWSMAGFYDPEPDVPDRSYSKWAGLLDEIRGFDPAFFDLTRREAAAMDPQQRILLQTAYEAVCDAMVPLVRLAKGSTGVFMGASNVDYGLLQRYRTLGEEPFAGTNVALSIIANRLSNRFDLTGPSVGVDTACSSALVAVDQACRSLAAGQCDVALAGGVNLLLDPRMFKTFCKARMLSPSGRLAAFDARADGFVRGEGAGVVVLKPLAQAVSDADRIYAVIRATRVNQDGRTGTITAPNPEAQIAILQALRGDADVDPRGVCFAEAHGTGTPLGDPIEAGAIGRVFAGRTREAPLPIGSVKPNIGHLEPAAGIAGLIKAALILHRRRIVPNVHFETPNPEIPFDALNLAVPIRARPLANGVRRPLALVNAFGFGGTNACALLEAFDGGEAVNGTACGSGSEPERLRQAQVPVAVSAASEAALRRVAGRLADALDKEDDLRWAPLDRVAAALARNRDHFRHRAVLLACDHDELRQALAVLRTGSEAGPGEPGRSPSLVLGRAATGRRLAFTFTGQGGQWWGMGRQLLTSHPVFRDLAERFDSVFRPVAGWSAMDALMADPGESQVDDAAVTPALVFVLQAGLAAVWKAWGVVPEVLIGHSFGEVTAAYVSGALSLETVAHLVKERGLVRDRIGTAGAMAAVGLDPEGIAARVPPDAAIEIAAYNAPGQVTVSGDSAAIDRLIAGLEADDPAVLARRLNLDFAWHSSWLEPGEDLFKSATGEIPWKAPETPVISTVTGCLETRFDTAHWWRNLRQPVLYRQAIEAALARGIDTFLELGPHRTLSSLTAGCAAGRGADVAVVSTLHRDQDDFAALAAALAELHVNGLDVDWARVFPGPRPHLVLPPYPWQEETFWQEPEEAGAALRHATVHPLLGTRESGPTPEWSSQVSLASHRFLADHEIDGETVFPAACYLEMMVASARQETGESPLELVDVRFHDRLVIEADDEIRFKTVLQQDRGLVRIFSRLRDGGSDWRLRAEARVLTWPLGATPAERVRPPADRAPDMRAREVYAHADARRYRYGESFRGITRVWRMPGEVIARVAVPESTMAPADSVSANPTLLDSCLQTLILDTGSTPDRELEDGRAAEADVLPSIELPTGARRIRIDGRLEREAWVRTVRDEGAGTNLLISAPGGGCVRIDGLATCTVPAAVRERHFRDAAAAFYGEVFEPVAVPGPADDGAPAGSIGRWLLIAGNEHAAGPVRDAFERRGGNVDACDSPRADAVAGHGSQQALARAITARDYRGMIYLAGEGDDDGRSVPERVERAVLSLTALGQVLERIRREGPVPPVWIVTDTARTAGAETGLTERGLTQRPLVGLGRTLRLECPEVDVRLIDVERGDADSASRVVDVILANLPESELLVRRDAVLAARVTARSETDMAPGREPVSTLAPDGSFKLTCIGGRDIEGLDWRTVAAETLAPDRARVTVRAAGLNFRDVMAATGLLPTQAEAGDAADALGLEFAGVVREVGPDVTRFAPGDAVLGLARGALAGRIDVPEHALWRLPGGLSETVAAGLPAALLTAHYALDRVGRLRRGERVLIQAATGGVGLAALALARRTGAEIFATAGSEVKRDHLRSLGVVHVMDSRTLAFSDEIMAATGGRGVDLVLNAQSGAYVDRGLACLAPFGRFIELGKRDVHDDRPLGLKALKANISFHVVDLSAMITERPDLLSELWAELAELLEAGEIPPLPTTVFPASRVRDGFRHLAAARHVGKVVVSLAEPDFDVVRPVGSPVRLDRDAAYLVTGGTRGFGLAVAGWLARHGAGRLVLASRSGAPDHDVAEAVDRLRQDGVEVSCLALDVTDSDRMHQAIETLAASDKPLRGIVHAAACYRDAAIGDMTRFKVLDVLRPKVAGAWNLLQAVRDAGLDLDFLLLFSSLTQLLGWPGQSNYAAANAFLEGLAGYCRSLGVPAQTINWGALGGSGFVARDSGLAAYLESAGMRPIDDETALAALTTALGSREPVLTWAGVDWERIASSHDAPARAARLAPLMTGAGYRRVGARAAIDAAEGDVRVRLIEQALTAEVARVLRARPESIEAEARLTDLGIDSLSSFELKNRVEAALGLTLPLHAYQQAATVACLGALIGNLLTVEARDSASDDRSGRAESNHVDPYGRRVHNGSLSGRSVAQSG